MQVNISIIVPIYNVSQYLHCCLDSLYSQTMQSIEIILVNDGSTDNSLSVCQQYQRKHSNTIIIDQPNGGLSDARNNGTKVASGKYIYYLDGDDWLVSDALQQLFNFAEENHCEIVQGNFYYAYKDRLLWDKRYMKAQILSRFNTMSELIKNNYIKNFAWGKLYRSDIVKRHQFPIGKYFEDCYWQHLIINEITKYGIVPIPLYYYRQRDDSISGRLSLKNLDLLKGYEERLSFINMKYPQYQESLFKVYWNVLYSFYTLSLSHKEYAIKKSFEDYWIYANNRYGSNFDIALKDSLKYQLVKNKSVLLSCYLFLDHLYHFLIPSPYKTIKI